MSKTCDKCPEPVVRVATHKSYPFGDKITMQVCERHAAEMAKISGWTVRRTKP